ncbi:MAG TPA: hypothetical protein VG078_01895 [Acidimicrobiales bacterium]|nr:hypothetical protein [Acidimicrobiales bacterium]
MLGLTAASSSSDRQAQARYLLQCVWTMATWVHRRVETVSFRDDRWAVRRVSVDLTVPSDQGGAFGDGDGMLVPLTFLRQRQVLRNFDCRDGAGNALPVLTRAENARVHRDMLLEAAWLALGHLDETVVAAVAVQARRRATELPDLPTEVAGVSEALGVNPQFNLVNELLRDQFLLLAWMHVCPGDRRVAKFCYDDELPFRGRAGRDVAARMGWRNETVEFPARAAAFGQSYHFAVNPPPEVVVDSTDLVETVRPDQIGLPEPEVWGERGHLVASGLTIGLRTTVRLELAARKDGWLQTAVASAWVTVLLLLAGAWGFFLDSPSDAAAALVVGLAAFLPAAVARPGEHALAARLLSGVRLMLAVLAALAVVAGARLAFFSPGDVDVWWLALGLLGLFPAAALSVSYGHAHKVMARRSNADDPGVRCFREVKG